MLIPWGGFPAGGVGRTRIPPVVARRTIGSVGTELVYKILRDAICKKAHEKENGERKEQKIADLDLMERDAYCGCW